MHLFAKKNSVLCKQRHALIFLHSDTAGQKTKKSVIKSIYRNVQVNTHSCTSLFGLFFGQNWMHMYLVKAFSTRKSILHVMTFSRYSISTCCVHLDSNRTPKDFEKRGLRLIVKLDRKLSFSILTYVSRSNKMNLTVLYCVMDTHREIPRVSLTIFKFCFFL